MKSLIQMLCVLRIKGLNLEKEKSSNSEGGSRYKKKHHLLGVLCGGAAGFIVGLLFGSENSLAISVVIGIVLGEIVGLFYSQFS